MQEKKNFQTDSHFWIGSSHIVNQDYCMTGISKEGRKYAVLCDGCSSSPNTDVGARVLALTASQHIDLIDRNYSALTPRNFEDFIYTVGAQARASISTLGLSRDSLNATLLIAITSQFGFNFICFGDGNIITINNNNEKNIYHLSFDSGAPLYLNYLLDRNDLNKYIDEFGLDYRLNGELISPLFYNSYISFTNLKTILLGSDGLQSFQETITTDTSKENIPVSQEKVCNELFDFKSFKGSFIKRRVKRFTKRTLDLNWSNSDDCSIAGISVLD